MKGMLYGAGLGAVAGYLLYGKASKDKDGKASIPLVKWQLGQYPYIAVYAALGALGGKLAQKQGIKPFAAKYGQPPMHFETDAFGQQLML